jgi:hypothetical protein
MSDSRLVRLSYASTATFEEKPNAVGIEVNVGRILMQSRRNNARMAIGGVLHYGDGCFFQCLEGEREAVEQTYQRIGEDSRHRDVEVLALNQVNERLFRDWSMKYVAIEKEIAALVKASGSKRFNPYEFDEALIQRLLENCVRSQDPTARAIPDPAKNAGKNGASPGFMKRWLGMA